MDIKAWLGTAGEPVADTAFTDETPLPFVVFLDAMQRGGGDVRNMMKTHSLTVERYSATTDDNTALEALLDAQAIKYKKGERQWLTHEECFMTPYYFDLIEREE